MIHDLIPKTQWPDFFRRISGEFRNQRIDLEVAGLDFGDQIEEAYVPLDGFSYEPNSDTLFVHSPAHEHEIFRPAEVSVSLDGGAIDGISIVDVDGRVHMVRFRHGLLLQSGQIV